MYRKFICLVSFVLVLGMVLMSTAKAEIVGWWKLDEGSGITAADSSGNGNNLTLNGDPQWVAGFIGNALEFDRNDDIKAATVSSVLKPASITVTAWVKADPATSGWSWVAGQGDNYGLVVNRDNDDDVHFYFHNSTAWTGVGSGDVGILDGKWHHIAGVFDDADGSLYVYKDGALVGAESAAGPIDYSAGVAVEDITTAHPTIAVHDPLHVKALVVNDENSEAVIICLDLATAPSTLVSDIRGRLQENLGIAPSNVLVSATHNHHTEGQEARDIAERTLKAVRRALDTIVPVKTGVGVGREARITMNRRLRMADGKQWTIRPPKRVLDQLKRIHSPVVVGIPPTNAYHDLMQMPDGEIRHYGVGRTGNQVYPIYISSCDCGLSWQEYSASERLPGACVQSPWSGDWLTVLAVNQGLKHEWSTVADQSRLNGTYVFRSSDGVDKPFTVDRISDVVYGMPRQPVALRDRHRWIVSTSVWNATHTARHPVVLYSDDDGHAWKQTILETVGPHKAEWPHGGVRWQNNAVEPTVVELGNGRLWMLMRTSLDNHHEAFSDDGGESWTTPRPSRFYGTLTMPTLLRLSDGRILLLWCNTTPLPEVDHDTQPELTDNERRGIGEDVFTNRDAVHAAISEDDGQTWIGFRELVLNNRRNDSDFRSSGGNPVLDKSVHQPQAIELPEGKVLVSLGQHPLCRKLVIFDPAWLCETERRDDFSLGLGNWSIHQYVKSLAGNFRGVVGHCAYNRRPGPQLIPDPDGEPREVLHIARYPDSRLLYEQQGATWNFPAGKAGQVRLRIRQPRGSQGTRICLLDRWFNPVDPVVQHFAQYVLDFDHVGRINGTWAMKQDCWQDLEIRWTNCENAEASLRVGESDTWTRIKLTRPSRNGICYVHIQSTATSTDIGGILLMEIAAACDHQLACKQ